MPTEPNSLPSSHETPEIPDHEVIKQIGAGSYGEVWLGRSVTGHYRAIKIVRRERFTDNRPFEREFNGIQKFEPVSRTHNSQVDILHVGRNDGFFYYVMELADDAFTEREIDPEHYGPRTLAGEMLQHGRLSAKQCVEIASSLTTALHHLHENGLVHRDVKPSNIIFVNGKAKLADIGLVSSADATMSVVGTEGFIPPEGPGSPQGDLYSLGKVLYEAATGMDRMEFPALPTNVQEIDERELFLELNAVVAKACRRDAKERYQSAQAMQADLILLQEGRSIRKSQRLEKQLGILKRAAVLLVAISLLGGSAWLYQRQQSAENELLAEQYRLAAEEAKANAEDSRKQVVKNHVGNSIREMDNGDIVQATLWSANALKLAQPGSQEEKIHQLRVISLLEQSPKLVAVYNRRVSLMNRDWNHLVIRNGNSGFRIIHPITGELIKTFSPDSNLGTLGSFLSEGGQKTFLLSLSSQQVKLSRMALESPHQVIEAQLPEDIHPPDHTRVLHSSPDGRYGLYLEMFGIVSNESDPYQHRVFLIDFENEGTSTVITNYVHSASVTDVEFSHSGKYVALSVSELESKDGEYDKSRTRRGSWQILDLENKTWLAPPTIVTNTGIYGVRWSPDDTRLIALTCDWDGLIKKTSPLHFWDVLSGELLLKKTFHQQRTIDFIYSPDGTQFATSSYDGTARVWDSETLEPITPPFIHDGAVVSVVFDPTGHLLATRRINDRTVQLWDLSNGEAMAQSLVHESVPFKIDWSPDGRYLSTETSELFRIWDFSNLTQHFEQEGFQNDAHYTSFAPNSSRVLSYNKRGDAIILDFEQRIQTQSWESTNRVEFVEWSSDESSLLLIDGDNTIQWRHLNTGNKREFIHPDVVEFARFHPDGTRFVTGCKDHRARLWDVNQPEEPLHVFDTSESHDEWFFLADFSPDGEILATAWSKQIWLWKVIDGTPYSPHRLPLSVQWSPFDHLTQLEFSTDGSLLIMATHKGEANLLQLDGMDISPLPWDRLATASVALSPNGRYVATGGRDHKARMWDISDSKLVGRPMPHEGSVTHVAFNPDSTLLVTASAKGNVRLWDVLSGHPVTAVRETTGSHSPLKIAQFSPSGSHILTVSEKGESDLWKLPNDQNDSESLLAQTRLLNSGLIDENSDLQPLTSQEFLDEWNIFQARHGTNPDLSDSERLRWHDSQVELSRISKSHDAVAEHLRVMTGLKPKDAQDFRIQGIAFAELEQWPQAEQALSKAMEINPGNFENAWNMAWVQLGLDQRESFSSTLRGLEQRLSSASDRDPLETLGWLSSVLPNSFVTSELYAALERRLEEMDDKNSHILFGMASLRMGLPELALTHLYRAVELNRAKIDRELYLMLSLAHTKNNEPAASLEYYFQQTNPNYVEDSFWKKIFVHQLQEEIRKEHKGYDFQQMNSATLPVFVVERDSETPAHLINLDGFYTVGLWENPHSGFRWSTGIRNHAELPHGMQVLDGTSFDIRGIIQLDGGYISSNRARSSRNRKKDFSKTGLMQTHRFGHKVKDIPVSQTCNQLHFLNGGWFPDGKGNETVYLMIHYTDGRSLKIPGFPTEVTTEETETRKKHSLKGSPSIAWTGKTPWDTIHESGRLLKLFKTTWKNPHPEVEIRSIDFVSTSTEASPSLIAITAE